MAVPKDLSKEASGPVAMEEGVSNVDSKAKPGNLGSFAHEMPFMNNREREKPHRGAMPVSGSGKF